MMITHPVSTAGSRRTVLHRAEDWLTLRSSMILFCSLKKEEEEEDVIHNHLPQLALITKQGQMSCKSA